MIEFAQSAAVWLGYVLMLLGGAALLAALGVLLAELVFKAVKTLYGMTIVCEALRAWHKANPERSRRYSGDGS